MFYVVAVNDDGDITVRRQATKPSELTLAGICEPDETPTVENSLEDVRERLKDYGAEESNIEEAIKEIESSFDWVRVY